MDNFGIFKLLSSLYDFYKKSNFNSKNNFNDNNSPDNSSWQTDKNTKENKEQTKPSPLTQNMLMTMYNHNAHINRVLTKNNKKWQ